MCADTVELCPNCDVPLETFSSAKDVWFSNGDKEFTVARIYILACPECHYEGKVWTA